VLQVDHVDAYYGGIHALKRVRVDVKEGEVVALIGANGAGKTTLINVISALVRASRGMILFEGRDITHLRPELVVEMGIGQIPEGRLLFGPLTVMENLELGAYTRRGKKTRKEVKRDRAYVLELFPILQDRLEQEAGTLSGGEQQMLAIARGLMGRPRLMLLDEPSLGLAPLVVKEIFEVIRRLNSEGTTILLVEQNARAALKVANRGYVMETGRIRLQGFAGDLLENKEVIKAYLGRDFREKP
jgi:branched-chain amino acid transport system ATP-binding protein